MRKLNTACLEVYFLIVLSESGTVEATLRILTGGKGGRLAKIKPSTIKNISASLFMTRVDEEGKGGDMNTIWRERGGCDCNLACFLLLLHSKTK